MERKSVLLKTQKKVEDFLKNLKGKLYQSQIIEQTNVDFYSFQIIKESLPKSLLRKIK